jgi:hypothetical protein
MAEIKVGTVTIVLPAGMVLDPRAGKLKPEDKKALPKARKGIGLACEQTSVAMEKSGDALPVPEVTAEGIRIAGKLAEDFDQVIEDVEVVLETLKQGNLLADAAAYTMLRKVNGQVKTRSQFDHSLRDRFQAVITYFAASPKSDDKPEPETTETTK